jgi:hypothetical protein
VKAAKDLSGWNGDTRGTTAGTQQRPGGLPVRDAPALLREDAVVVAMAAGNLARGGVEPIGLRPEQARCRVVLAGEGACLCRSGYHAVLTFKALRALRVLGSCSARAARLRRP